MYIKSLTIHICHSLCNALGEACSAFLCFGPERSKRYFDIFIFYIQLCKHFSVVLMVLYLPFSNSLQGF